jgi:hypothetical protein
MSSFITAEIAQSIKSGIARNIGPYAQQLVEEAAQFVFSILENQRQLPAQRCDAGDAPRLA